MRDKSLRLNPIRNRIDKKNVRKNQCRDKTKWDSLKGAVRFLRDKGLEDEMRAYWCSTCGRVHVGH